MLCVATNRGVAGGPVPAPLHEQQHLRVPDGSELREHAVVVKASQATVVPDGERSEHCHRAVRILRQVVQGPAPLVADPNDEVQESNEDNNALEITFTVP